MPVDPGHHAIDASAPNKLPFHKEVDVGSRGAQEKVIVSLEPAPVTQTDNHTTSTTTTTTTTPPPQSSSGGGMRIAGITMLGVGVAGAIVGGIFGGLAIGKRTTRRPTARRIFRDATPQAKRPWMTP